MKLSSVSFVQRTEAPRPAGRLPSAVFSPSVPTPEEAASGAGRLPSWQEKRADRALVRDFDALYAKYEKPVYNFILRAVSDPQDADDLTIETFTSAYKARDTFRGEARLSTWLYKIAHNHCKNRFKQRGRQREFEGPSLDAAGPDTEGDGAGPSREIADWSYAPALLLERKELRVLVEQAVDALAPEYRTVLTLREMEGLTYNEIVDVTGLTLEAVKTRLNRARAQVRRRVEPYYTP